VLVAGLNPVIFRRASGPIRTRFHPRTGRCRGGRRPECAEERGVLNPLRRHSAPRGGAAGKSPAASLGGGGTFRLPEATRTVRPADVTDGGHQVPAAGRRRQLLPGRRHARPARHERRTRPDRRLRSNNHDRKRNRQRPAQPRRPPDRTPSTAQASAAVSRSRFACRRSATRGRPRPHRPLNETYREKTRPRRITTSRITLHSHLTNP